MATMARMPSCRPGRRTISISGASSGRQRWAQEQAVAQYVSSDAVGCQDLDDNGQWQQEPDQGTVWFPSGVAADWAPYSTATGPGSGRGAGAGSTTRRGDSRRSTTVAGAASGARWGWVPCPPHQRAVYAPRWWPGLADPELPVRQRSGAALRSAGCRWHRARYSSPPIAPARATCRTSTCQQFAPAQSGADHERRRQSGAADPTMPIVMPRAPSPWYPRSTSRPASRSSAIASSRQRHGRAWPRWPACPGHRSRARERARRADAQSRQHAADRDGRSPGRNTPAAADGAPGFDRQQHAIEANGGRPLDAAQLDSLREPGQIRRVPANANAHGASPSPCACACACQWPSRHPGALRPQFQPPAQKLQPAPQGVEENVFERR